MLRGELSPLVALDLVGVEQAASMMVINKAVYLVPSRFPAQATRRLVMESQ
jgi:hypothetical protein